jgi:hypothetical protein
MMILLLLVVSFLSIHVDGHGSEQHSGFMGTATVSPSVAKIIIEAEGLEIDFASYENIATLLDTEDDVDIVYHAYRNDDTTIIEAVNVCSTTSTANCATVATYNATDCKSANHCGKSDSQEFNLDCSGISADYPNCKLNCNGGGLGTCAPVDPTATTASSKGRRQRQTSYTSYYCVLTATSLLLVQWILL